MKQAVIIGLLAFMPLLASAGSDDFGMWFGAGVEKKLSKKWSVECEAEYRLADMLKATDRLSIGVSTAYKLTKWLKADVGYDYLHSRKPGEYSDGGKYYKSTYWYPRHRGFVSLAANVKLAKGLHLSLRERWVYTYCPSFDRNRINVDETSKMYGVVSSKEVESKGSSVLRSRLLLDYKPKKSNFIPFISVEMYNTTSGYDAGFFSIEKMKYSIGTEYEVSKHHSLKLYYTFQDRRQDDGDSKKGDIHVIGVNYNFSF